MRDQINAAGAGVTASVLSDANGARLVLRSTATGASNGFRVGVTDTDGNNTDGAGLSALAFDPSAGVTTMAQALAAANASATLNNLPISSESNTLANVLDGMTLTLNKVTTAPVQLTAAQDNTSMRKALDTFVTAYNDLNKLLADQTKYDAGTKAAGGLQGDSAAVGIRAQMRAMVGSTGGVSTMFTRLSDIGFDVKLDGSLTLSDTKINNALANLAETKKLFANTDLLVPGNNGIANQMRALADRLIGVDGTVSTRSEGLRKRIDLNQDRQDLLSDRIAAVEKRLRAQYTALDKTMGQLDRPVELHHAAVHQQQQQQQLSAGTARLFRPSAQARGSSSRLKRRRYSRQATSLKAPSHVCDCCPDPHFERLHQRLPPGRRADRRGQRHAAPAGADAARRLPGFARAGARRDRAPATSPPRAGRSAARRASSKKA